MHQMFNVLDDALKPATPLKWQDQWRRRLECVIQQQGGHIEYLM